MVLSESCACPVLPLSLTAHTGTMNPAKPQKVVLLVLAALLVGAWALIIFVAIQVTQTALETLSYIVELAQMTP